MPDILVGAGTVLTPGQADAAVAAGAQFLVSPGVTPSLLDHMLTLGIHVLPGVATVGEVMAVLERGLDTMKFSLQDPPAAPTISPPSELPSRRFSSARPVESVSLPHRPTLRYPTYPASAAAGSPPATPLTTKTGSALPSSPKRLPHSG